MDELKNVNVKFTLLNIERVRSQSKQNKRTFQAELELILNEYFDSKTKQKETETK